MFSFISVPQANLFSCQTRRAMSTSTPFTTATWKFKFISNNNSFKWFAWYKKPKKCWLEKKKHHLLGGVQYRLQVYLRSSIRVLQKSLEHAYGKSEFLKMITCNDLDTSKIHLPRLIQNPLSSGIVVVTRFSWWVNSWKMMPLQNSERVCFVSFAFYIAICLLR